MEEHDSVSNKTITVLVVLTVVITVMSTLAVINAVNQLEKNPPATVEASNQGEVALTITEGSNSVSSETTQTSSVTGQVGLEVLGSDDATEETDESMDVQLPE